MSTSANLSDAANVGLPTAELPPEQWEFSVTLRQTNGGAVLAREAVGDADLHDLQCEVWRDACLRKGKPDVGFDSLQFRLGVQRDSVEATRCTGVQLRGRTACGWRFDRDFGTDVFADAAARIRQRLINEKVVKLDELISFEVHASRRSAVTTNVDWTLESDDKSIEYVTRPLAPLLSKAQSVCETNGEFPVIYTEEALAQAEQFSRRGAASNPPIETGGVLIGPLCSCPETGELFVVVCNVLEVQDAEEATFSLSYTNESWIRIQNIVQAMRSQPASKAHQIVGQCHGHNFPPAGGAPPCDACLSQAECHRRSDVASVDDRIWTQATFSRAPWALCHIFGTNARNDNIQSLYTLRDNQLQSRGFHVVPEFQPTSQ